MTGLASTPPDRLLRASLLQVLYTVQSERLPAVGQVFFFTSKQTVACRALAFAQLPGEMTGVPQARPVLART